MARHTTQRKSLRIVAMATLVVLACCARVAHAAVDAWVLRNPVVDRADLFSVTRGGGQWVVVGNGGIAATSPDARLWTRRDTGTTSLLFAVTHGGGRFFAAGEGGLILSSDDGVVWRVARTANVPSGSPITGGAYGAGRCVFARADGTILTSRDSGITWVEQSPVDVSLQPRFRAITYANGRFVAVGEVGAYANEAFIVGSTDGDTWTRVAAGLTISTGGFSGSNTFRLNAVAYGVGVFVAVGDTMVMLVSPDGVTWVRATPPNSSTARLTSVAFDGTGFVAGLDGSDYYLTSPDGANWTQRNASGEGQDAFVPTFLSLACFEGRTMGVGRFGLITTRAGEGAWQVAAGFPAVSVTGVAYGNGRFVNVGFASGRNTQASGDGVTWQSGDDNGLSFSQVAYGGGRFVATGFPTGSNTYRAYTSTDGLAWSAQGTAPGLAAIVYARGKFFGVGDGFVANSADGTVWTQATAPAGAIYTGMSEGNGRFVAVGYNRALATSDDGVAWTARTSPTTRSLGAVAFGAGRFVAVATDTVEAWSSADGVSWNAVTLPAAPAGGYAALGFWKIVFAEGRFLAGVGTDLLTSSDGVSWSVQPQVFGPAGNKYFSFAHGNGTYLAVGDGKIFQSSPDSTAIALGPISADQIVVAGQSATLTVAATGSNLSYQWYRGPASDVSAPVSGGTAATLTVPAVAAGATYWARITNATTFVDSPVLRVAIAAAPSFSAVSPGLELAAGQMVTLDAPVSGFPTPAVQWFEGARGDTSRPIPSATIMMEARPRTFWVRATNLAGTTDGPELRLNPWVQVGPPPSFSGVREFDGVLVGLGGDEISTSIDGRGWKRVASIANVYWRDIARGEGLYVAVGDRAFYSSPDLKQWTARNLIPGESYIGATTLAYGNGKFVAVGYRPFVSANGIDWTELVLPAGISFISVVFDGGRFVAVGNSFVSDDANRNQVGVVFTSTDGLGWTRVATDALPETAANTQTTLDNIAFAGGKFLATSRASNVLLLSTDAVTWTRQNLGSQSLGIVNSAGFVGGRYVLGLGGDRYFTSDDASTWTVTVGPRGLKTLLLRSTSAGLLACGSDGTAHRTTDGWTWQALAGSPNSFTAVAYGFGRYFAVGSYDGFYSSDDGIAWTSQGTAIIGSGSLAFAANRFWFASEGSLQTSSDGKRWSSQPSIGLNRSNLKSVGTRLFGWSANRISSTLDGETWTIPADPTPSFINGLAYGNGVYVVAATRDFATSSDGVSWTSRAAAENCLITDIAFGHGLFVAIGSRSSVDFLQTSTDGVTWVEQSVPFSTRGFYSIVFTGDRFVAATGNGVLFSHDGRAWSLAPGTSSPVVRLTVVNGVVLGTSFSTNKILWHRVADGVMTSITSVSPAQSVSVGASATLRVAALGPNLNYQWYRGASGDVSAPVAGATAATLLTPALVANASFWVRVSGPGGSVDSAAVRVTVAGLPTIVRQPLPFDSLPMQIETESFPAATYQWYRGQSGETSLPIPGATGPVLLVPTPVQTSRYWVRASNSSGHVDSTSTLLQAWETDPLLPAGVPSYGTAGLAAGPTRLVVTGMRTSPQPFVGMVQYSTDGLSWSAVNADQLGSVAAGNGRFVATGIPIQNRLYTSVTGESWSSTSLLTTSTRFTDVFFAGGLFFAVAMDGTLASSADGANWTTHKLTTGVLSVVAHGGGRWLVGGAAGKLFRSLDGATWVETTSPTSSLVGGLVYAGGGFVLFAADGNSFASTDGVVWQRRAVETIEGLLQVPAFRRMHYVNGRFFTAAPSVYQLSYCSSDGLLWWPHASVPDFGRLEYYGGRYLGTNQTVMVFANGGYSAGGGAQLYRSRPEVIAPVIASPPVAQALLSGQTISLSVGATSAATMSYQWLRNGQPLAGATGPTLTITQARSADSGDYSVVVFNSGGGVTSAPVNVTVTHVDPPAIIAPPTGRVAALGGSVTLSVGATGTGPLVYRWKKDSALLSGASASGLTLSNLQATDAGNYQVEVSNVVGSVTSAAVRLFVRPAALTATHSVVGGVYAPATETIVTNTLTYEGSAPAVIWQVVLPVGWTLASTSGDEGAIKPAVGSGDLIEWRWAALAPGPMTFSYRLAVPAVAKGNLVLNALVSVSTGSGAAQFLADPDPLVLRAPRHSADTNGDFRMSLTELTRVIELFNTRQAGARTGAYTVATAASEDGFTADPARAVNSGAPLAAYHTADADRDGRFSLFELTRVIELYNTLSGTTRTGAYHVAATPSSTEDGFVPGP